MPRSFKSPARATGCGGTHPKRRWRRVPLELRPAFQDARRGRMEATLGFGRHGGQKKVLTMLRRTLSNENEKVLTAHEPQGPCGPFPPRPGYPLLGYSPAEPNAVSPGDSIIVVASGTQGSASQNRPNAPTGSTPQNQPNPPTGYLVGKIPGRRNPWPRPLLHSPKNMITTPSPYPSTGRF